MSNCKILYVNDKKFDLDQLDNIMKKNTPGSYKIVWTTKKNVWEMYLRWTGLEWYDLHPN